MCRSIILLSMYAIQWIGQNAHLPAQEAAIAGENSGIQFDLEALSAIPEVFPADDMQAEGVKSFYYSGPLFKGKPTRAFAYAEKQ